MTLSYYKSCELMMMSLIIIKIKFIHFQKEEFGWSRIRLRARLHDYRSRDNGVTFFSLLLFNFLINSCIFLYIL